MFASALGLTQADALLLSDRVLRAAREQEALAGDKDGYGERFTLDFEWVRGNRGATFGAPGLSVKEKEFDG